MWRALSRRGSTLLGLFHITSLLVVTTTAAAVDGIRGRWATRVRRAAETPRDGVDGPGAGGEASGSCRCAAEQWEGVLRSVDREFYVDGVRTAGRPRLSAAELESNTAIHYDRRLFT